ncbi:hypothetical protein HQ545_08505 [Candidatus Woesearchaeota archaeon]|nr:hypothetical protein [Candidatus Woesearchaeota archaeon]
MSEQTATPPGMSPPQGLPGSPPAKKPGLFAPKPKPGTDISKSVSDIAGEMNNISRRLMIIEERYTNLRKKTQVTDQNMLANNKKFMTEVHTAHDDVDDVKKQVHDIIDKLKIIVRELKDCAKRQDVDVLQKYINIWEPINFITRDSAMKMIKDQVDAQFKDLNIRLQQEDYIKEQISLHMRDLKKQ